jgi:hypothetical protein
VGERRLEFVKRLLSLDGPREALVQELVEGKPFSPSCKMKRLKAARYPNTFCTPLRSRIGPIRSRAVTFSGLGLMPC